MSLPEGIRKPRRVLFLIPILLLLLVVAAAAVHYWSELSLQAPGMNNGPGIPPSRSSAIPGGGLMVGGIVLLGLAIAYGAWRYHTRPRELDAVTEKATRKLYREPEPGVGHGERPPEARSS